MNYIDSLVGGYCKEVLSGNGKHGEREILAVERFISDRKRKDIYLDEEKVKKRLKAAKLIRHTKDAFYGVPFTLQPFQIFAIVNLFGWYWKRNNKRRFKKFYLDIARKNGKTEFASLLVVLLWFFETIPGGECYFAATKRDQAKIGFDTTKVMLKQLRQDSGFVASRVRILANSIIQPLNESKMVAVSSDSKTLDGLNPSIALVDELHAHPTNKVLKVLETGMGSRENPMILITTTAGFEKTYPAYRYRETATNVLKGVTTDDTLFPLIFAMDDGDDWEDSKNWWKCNPNAGVSLNMDWLKEQYNSAKNEGSSSINEFKTKNLNIYTSSSLSFIEDSIFMRNKAEPEVENYSQKWWGGLDLSNNEDLTCFCLLGEDGSVIPYFFVPEKKIENRDNRDGVDYLQWFDDGHLIKIPGETVDLRFVKQKIMQLNAKYNILNICYDPWRNTQLAKELTEKRVPMMKMVQNYKNYTECISDLQVKVINGEFKHGGNPVLRWNNENTTLKLGSNNTMMFDRSNTKTKGGKIDGMVALAMAQFGSTNDLDNKYRGAGPRTISKL